MNVNSPSGSCNLSPCTVTSKYFIGKTGMDESLSDFKEKKSSRTGPKKAEKLTGTKTKAKKPLKRIRGQKDIRAVVKSKKNELIAYANDFDKICKQSGIDIDSEQLQLAIALSKSLQQSETNSDRDTQSTNSLNSQERTGKIRTTLQEYGFKVPELKITVSKNRRLKHRKQYKLLLVTPAEKEQKISDRYSQVLFQNVKEALLADDTYNFDVSKAHMYNIATNIAYESIRSDSIYYIDGLIDKNQSNIGCLLRNWSEIPGRPASPVFETSEVDFKKIKCSQDELDNVLSGTLKIVQEIVKNKHINLPEEVSEPNSVEIERNVPKDIEVDANMHTNTVEIIDDNSSEKHNPKIAVSECHEDIHIDIDNLKGSNALSAASQIRSCSPDLFDDEVYSILNNSKDSCASIHLKESCKSVTKDNIDFMDLTECVNVGPQKITVDSSLAGDKPLSQLSQGTDVTKRKTNDYMEITDCVAGSSQPIREYVENIDLTQSSEHESSDISVLDEETSKSHQNINFTQTPEYNSGVTVAGEYSNLRNSKIKELVEVTESSNNDISEITDVDQDTLIKNYIIEKNVDLDSSEVTVLDENNTENKVEENTDLRHISDLSSSKVITLVEKGAGNEIERMDLTKSPNTDDSLPFVQISGKDTSLDDTIIVNDEAYFGIGNNPKSLSSEEIIKPVGIDAIISKNYDPKPETYTSPTKHTSFGMKSPVLLVIDSDGEDNANQIMNTCNGNSAKKLNNSFSSKEEHVNNFSANSIKTRTERFFDEFVHQHSDNECKELDDDVLCLDESNNGCKELDDDVLCLDESNNGCKELDDDVLCLDESIKKSSDSSKDQANSDIGLTHTSKSSDESANGVRFKNLQSPYDSLGKKDVSIDYDELFDNLVESHTSNSKQSNMSGISDVYDDIAKDKNNVSSDKLSKNSDFEQSSQNSEIFEIVDQELDYSFYRSRHEKDDNFDIGGLSVMENLSKARNSKSTGTGNHTTLDGTTNDSFLPLIDIKGSKTDDEHKKPVKYTEASTPFRKLVNNDQIVVETPTNSEYIIKTDQVTPMLNFASLTTPERNNELNKYGLKPFKRKRAIQLLTHIYNQTHPIIESCSREDLLSPSKKQKTNHHTKISPKKLQKSPKKQANIKSPMKNMESNSKYPRKEKENANTEDTVKENGIYNVTSDIPVIKDIECTEEDWVFQKREKAKVHSCRVPLHIAFHNYVSARRCLREALLRYEPIDIDVVHKGLVASGYRYDPKDLLKFMDKKCITVKTADNNNKKHY